MKKNTIWSGWAVKSTWERKNKGTQLGPGERLTIGATPASQHGDTRASVQRPTAKNQHTWSENSGLRMTPSIPSSGVAFFIFWILLEWLIYLPLLWPSTLEEIVSPPHSFNLGEESFRRWFQRLLIGFRRHVTNPRKVSTHLLLHILLLLLEQV